MRVEVRGKIYDSVPECAKALGVAPATVYCAVTRRTTDTLGLGKGNRTSRRGGRPPKRVKIGEVEFPSMAAASRALGFNQRHVQHVLSRGKAAARGRLLRAAMEYQAQMDKREIARRAS
ncbi:hypothetical protein [Pseudodonghicola flavimaris]|uniref:Helix-turn-helix domain-containing protein n=1 Tax=Pseudodonghicola flavimaris TaxID=3050036 RepID=A0ABT7EW63_9RHOB|nr:hypothetical protein [Pseudodonghicola flavimaris]MDK3016529.1 hypothetical protein [Pseudodonghicola flavimaris]